MAVGVIDEEELARRLGALTGATVSALERLTGGASSLTYGAVLGDQGEQVVVKVAPPGVPPVLNRDVLRQARILRALAPFEKIPVPAVLWEDSGDPPGIPPLFVMRRVPGQSIEPITHEGGELPPPAELRSRQLRAAELLGAIHDVPVRDIGLAGEPIVALADEVRRWARVFETAPEDLVGEAQPVAEALLATVPEPMPPVLVHGDYRLGNTLCEAHRIRAVIDWEIWCIGDPRIDVAWWLMSTDRSKQPNAKRRTPGMPPDHELVRAYERSRRIRLERLHWFDALSRYKAGAMTALIVKHDRRRSDRDPLVRSWDPAVPLGFVDLARACLRSGEESATETSRSS